MSLFLRLLRARHATCPAHISILDFIAVIILGEWCKYEVPRCEAFSTSNYISPILGDLLFASFGVKMGGQQLAYRN